jgi:hypothetical protein
MKLISMVLCTRSKQDYDAMILKASTKTMLDDLKSCAMSNTEISYEVRSSSSFKNRNRTKLKETKSLSRIKSTVSYDERLVDMHSGEPMDVAPDTSDGVCETRNTNDDGTERNVYSVELTDAHSLDKSNGVFEAQNANDDGAECNVHSKSLSEQEDIDGSNVDNHEWYFLSNKNITEFTSDTSYQHKIDIDKERKSSGDAQNVDKSNGVFKTQNKNDNGVVRNVHSGGLSDAQNVDLVVVLPSVKDDVIVVLPNDVLMLVPLTKTLFICKNNVNIKVIDALRVAGYPTSDATGWLEIDSVDYEIKETLQSLVPNNDIFAFSVHFYSLIHSFAIYGKSWQ